MVIGLISDTHGYLDPKIAEHFQSVDEIWHAGDLGEDILNQLQIIRPTFAVYGNIDNHSLRHQCPENLWLSREGLRILITHIAGRPPKYNSRVKQMLTLETPDILICGHSHILKVAKDPLRNNMLFINPGAAGRQGFHKIKTIMRMTLIKGRVAQMEVVELGKRGAMGP